MRGTGWDEEAEAEDGAAVPAEKEKLLRPEDGDGAADRGAKLQDAGLP